jgi:hypothetical protein
VDVFANQATGSVTHADMPFLYVCRQYKYAIRASPLKIKSNHAVIYIYCARVQIICLSRPIFLDDRDPERMVLNRAKQ